MNNSANRNRFIQYGLIIIIMTMIFLSSCGKNNSYINEKLLGTWISTDLADTIEFTTDKDFYKMISGLREHFDYSSSQDSMTIRYHGTLYIYVFPTTHKYQIKSNTLTIDFRPHCYGFREQMVTFTNK